MKFKRKNVNRYESWVNSSANIERSPIQSFRSWFHVRSLKHWLRALLKHAFAAASPENVLSHTESYWIMLNHTCAGDILFLDLAKIRTKTAAICTGHLCSFRSQGYKNTSPTKLSEKKLSRIHCRVRLTAYPYSIAVCFDNLTNKCNRFGQQSHEANATLHLLEFFLRKTERYRERKEKKRNQENQER